MAFPMKSALMALALLCLSAARVGAAQLPSAGTTDSLGLDIHFTWPPDQDMEMIQAAGAKVVRTDCFGTWPRPRRRVLRLFALGCVDNAVAARGIRMFTQLDYTNSLYGAACSANGIKATPIMRRRPLAHFKGKGVIWEMYNEPNTNILAYGDGRCGAVYGNGQSSRSGHAHGRSRLHDHRARACRCRQGGPTDFFTICCQQGLLNLVDAVSIHPYRWSPTVENPETLVPDYASIKSLISTYHPSGSIPIVSSEFGYPTTAVTPQTQGDYLARSFLINLSQGIPISIAYDWKDDGKDTTNPEDNFGIVKTDYTPKPAYNEMQLLTKSLRGETFTKQLNDNHTSDWRSYLRCSGPLSLMTLALFTPFHPGTSAPVTVKQSRSLASATPLFSPPSSTGRGQAGRI